MAKRTGVTPLLVTIVEARDIPSKDGDNQTDAFAVLEVGGVRNQTEVVRCSTAPVWDHSCTMRAVFTGGVREELLVHLWHEEVFEDELLGQASIDLSSVLHERESFDSWIPLLDESNRKNTGIEVLVRIENGSAPPLAQLCTTEEVTLELLERTLAQDPGQCDEREVC